LLVVGDDHVRTVAAIAGARGRRPIVGHVLRPDAAAVATTDWDELVVDAALLEELRQRHHDLLRGARRVWVVVSPPGPRSDPAVDPFRDPIPTFGRVVKRLMDIALALVGLVLSLPVMALAMMAVRLDSPGPALFRQARVGANGKRFRLYKIRTMRHGCDEAPHRDYVSRLIDGTAERCGPLFKLVGDPRITRVGRLLRRFSVDELPQLWNVLRGDMSMVGPRPPLPGEAELYGHEAWLRLRVKPGITGLWQVSGRSALSFDEMLALDVRYWQQWSLARDVSVLLKTPRVVLTGAGAA
jgi:lipopolysaccharide/colanic/teichoic acid biosynthesis glycosyltransferase